MTKPDKITHEQILSVIGNRRIHAEPVGGWRQKVVDRASRRTRLVGGPEWSVDSVSCWTMRDVRRVVADYDRRVTG